MKPRPEAYLASQIAAVIGEDGLVALAQALGGTRLYVPQRPPENGELIRAVGRDRAEALSRVFAPATLRMPLAREERARAYRAQGLSNARIALRLGMTETGVSKLFSRAEGLQERPSRYNNPNQPDLF